MRSKASHWRPALWRWIPPGAAAILLSAKVARLYNPYLIVDDAFISFRYADNLARGLGLVYNLGERVEGYSNFLWTLLLAAGARLGLDLPELSILLAFAAAVATVVLLWAWSSRVFGRRATAIHVTGRWADAERWLLSSLPPLLFAATGSQARYVVSGMETLLFGLLVLAAAYLLLERDAPLAAGCAFALAAMTRPEAPMYLLVAVGALLLPRRSRPAASAPPTEDLLGSRVRRGLRLVLSFAAIFLPYVAWRWHYYGYLLPNTYYAKASGLSWNRIAQGASMLVEVAGWWSIAPLGLVAAAALPSLRRSRTLQVCAGFVVATTLYFVVVGGDFLAFFGPRFLMPALPFLLLLASQGLRNLLDGGCALFSRPGPATARDPAGQPDWPQRVRVWRVTVLAVLGGLLLANGLWLSWPARHFDARALAQRMESWEEMGRWLGAYEPPSTLIADGGAGIVPYYSRLTNIDMYGLADAHIAHLEPLAVGFKTAAHEKYDPRYVLGRHPDLLITALDRDRSPRTAGLPRVKDWVWACYRPLALLRDFPDATGGWLLPSEQFTPELFDAGYRVAVLERRQGPDGRACRAYERTALR